LQVRDLQETLETIKYDIGSKRKSAAIEGTKKARMMLSGKTADKMAAACQSPKTCSEYIKQIDVGLDPLTEAIKTSQDSFQGSDQERDALDKAYIEQEKVVHLLTQLEEQMIPPGYETPVPPEYSDLPQLKRRAKVEMILKKGEPGAQFDVNGVNYPQTKLVMVIDGYTGKLLEHRRRENPITLLILLFRCRSSCDWW
jgi:peptidylprolyl isomerase